MVLFLCLVCSCSSARKGSGFCLETEVKVNLPRESVHEFMSSCVHMQSKDTVQGVVIYVYLGPEHASKKL